MGTRSIVARQEGAQIHAIYCHWDGHITSVGKTLQNHYVDPDRVAALIALGDCSSICGKSKLAPNPGTKHTFDEPQDDVVIAYGRDRGEKGTEPSKVKTEKALFKLADRMGTEYVYLYRDGAWQVSSHGEFRAFGVGPDKGSNWKPLQSLADALPIAEKADA